MEHDLILVEAYNVDLDDVGDGLLQDYDCSEDNWGFTVGLVPERRGTSTISTKKGTTTLPRLTLPPLSTKIELLRVGPASRIIFF